MFLNLQCNLFIGKPVFSLYNTCSERKAKWFCNISLAVCEKLCIGIREPNPCALCLLNFRTTVFSGFTRRQPCFTLQKQLNENFPAHRVVELKKSKFFARNGTSAVNSISINEHFNALLRKICLFEPHGVRLPYA